MKSHYLFILVLLFFSCKKSHGPAIIQYNHEYKSTVVFNSGSLITINATGAKALMGCDGIFCSGTYVDGTNESNAAIYITCYSSTFCNCISSPGTYSFTCEYRTNTASTNTPIYENRLAGNPGSITFTAIDDHYMEGHFNAVCRYNTDSVTVSGTFKGNY